MGQPKVQPKPLPKPPSVGRGMPAGGGASAGPTTATAGNAAISSKHEGEGGSASVPVRVLEALREFAAADAQEVSRVVGAWVEKKQGDGKEVERQAGKLGKVTTTHEVSGGAGLGAYGKAGRGKVDLGSLGRAYEALVEAGVVVGAELKLSGSVQKELGPVAIKAAAAIKGFAGAYARGSASGRFTSGDEWWQKGVEAKVKGEAFAGAKAQGETSVSFTYDDFGAEAFGEGAAMAGAEANAEGAIAIDLAAKRIAIGGEVSALAGVRASGTAGGKAKLYGRDAFTGKVTGEVSAGVGGSATMGFKLERGVLTINTGGAATAGVGGGVTTNLITDFKPIAVFVWRKVSQVGDALPGDRSNTGQLLTDPQSKLRKDLREYRDKKLTLVRGGRADGFVKVEKVQAYIDWHLARHRLREAKDTTWDQAIKQLVEQECSSPADGLILQATVRYGYLQKLELTDDDAVGRLAAGTVDADGSYSAKPTAGRSGRDLSSVGS